MLMREIVLLVANPSWSSSLDNDGIGDAHAAGGAPAGFTTASTSSAFFATGVPPGQVPPYFVIPELLLFAV